MTWIWLSATVVLVGAEVNAEMEHQTARDTTTGPEKSAGSRGATKATRLRRLETAVVTDGCDDAGRRVRMRPSLGARAMRETG